MSDKKAPINRPLRTVALFEICIFLAVASLLDLVLFDGDRFRYVEPHPFWAVVILISVHYGTRLGVLAAIASSAFFLTGNIPVRLLEQNLHEWAISIFKLPLLWFVSAVLIGEVSARRIRAHQLLSEDLIQSKGRESALLTSLKGVNAIKERLEVRIAGQWSTVRKTLTSAKEIEHMEPERALQQSLALVENMLQPEKFSVYLIEGNSLVFAYSKGWDKETELLRQLTSEMALFSVIVGERRTVCISRPKDELILGKQGVLAGPLIDPDTDELIGMLKIEKTSFSQLSIGALINFEFLCEWIASIYAKSLEYKMSNSPELDVEKVGQRNG
ncbi:MAG: GAF domain-containing protein [Gammaproteobacteria bacterium]|nr:GAF domain-containing protein [Gammaproteobacteria bacterium]